MCIVKRSRTLIELINSMESLRADYEVKYSVLAVLTSNDHGASVLDNTVNNN
jgi:hypothetical protein